MPLFCSFRGPVLGTTPGSHSNQAWFRVTEKHQEVLATDLLVNDLTTVFTDEVNLSYR